MNGNWGLFKTTDQGDSWNHIMEEGMHPIPDELIVSPRDAASLTDTVWYVSDVGQVHITQDGGVTWGKLTDPFSMPDPVPDEFSNWVDAETNFRFGSVYAVATAPSDPNIIYALKNGFGLFKSADGGAHWQYLPQSEVDYTYSLVVHPTNPDIVYSGYNPKPFEDWAMVRQTTDGGDSWRTALTVPHAGAVTSVVIDPNDPDTVYAGSTGEGGVVWVSHDAGDNWAKVNEWFNFTNIHVMTADPGNPDVAYAGVWGGGTFRTTDGGQSWSRLPNDPTISASAILVDPTNSDVIYLADRTAPRIYRSTDGGTTWETYFDAGAGYYRVMTAAIAAGSPDIIYASIFLRSGMPLAGHVFRIENGNGTDITGALPRLPVALAVDPTDADTIFAALHTKGVYKTTDGGQNWSDISAAGSGLPYSPHVGFNGLVVAAASLTNEPDTLYLIGGCDVNLDLSHTGADPEVMNTVYKSTDGGATWTNLNDGNLGAASSSIKGLAISPDDPEVLYVGTLRGIWRSDDGGVSWANVSTGLGYTHTAGIALSSDGRRLYAPTLGGGVYGADVDTTTHDVTWNEESHLMAEINHVQIAIDPTDSQTLYASAYPGGVFKSTDGGLTWGEANFGMASFKIDDPSRQGYYAFAIAPSDPTVLYLGLYSVGMYKSTDGAGTWRPMNGSTGLTTGGSTQTMRGQYITSLLIDPGDADIVYVATEDGVFHTSDGGLNWADMSAGLDTPDIRVLTMGSDGSTGSPHGGRLYAGSRGYELYAYDHAGAAWGQLSVFTNFGQEWPIWDRAMYQLTTVAFHPTDPEVVYVGTFPAGMFKTTDGGQSWREINVGWGNDGVFSLVFHPENPDIIYAGAYNGINRSTDAGARWEAWDQGWPDEQWVYSIAFDPRDPNVMYGCSKNGENKGNGREGFQGTVMKSTNGGASWFPITSGLNLNQEFYEIIVDPRQPGTLYLATQFEGVFISRDDGAFWTPWNEGLTHMDIGSALIANPMTLSADGTYLYLGTNGSGVFRRELGTTKPCPDLDGNGTVDIVDIMLVAVHWGMTSADPDWDPRYDLDADGGIDIADIMFVVNRWGERCD